MIQLVTLQHPKLQGVRNFGFRTNHDQQVERTLGYHSPEDERAQIRSISQVEASILELQHVACEANVTISVSHGSGTCEGNITVFEEGGKRKASAIIGDLCRYLRVFMSRHAESDFSIEFVQTFEVTHADRQSLH